MTPGDFHDLRRLVRYDAGKRARAEAACGGKHKFASFTEADGAIRGEKRREIAAYHCAVCRGYHVGSRDRQRRLVVRRRLHEETV